jgi:hypothetical protein
VLREDELDPIFDAAQWDVFRLEVQQTYAVEVESPRLRSYLNGEPYDRGAEPTAWYDYIQGWTNRGITFRKVHVVRSPLSEYLRFECEWSYTATEKRGQRSYILDLAETPDPPPLPDYDFWMFDERTVLRFHYNYAGGFVGAELLAEADAVRHVGYRDAALAASVPFPDYWVAHPQYWRENWLVTRDQ